MQNFSLFRRLILGLIIGALCHSRATAQIENPLAPAVTTSPRDTIKTFVENMNRLYKAVRESGFRRSTEFRKAQRIYAARAVRCLDLREIPPNVVENVQTERAVLLTELFDRVTIPDYSEIPGNEQVKEEKVTSWTVPNTAIEVAQVQEGPRKGEFLFSPETIDRLPEFYERAKHLPYKPGTILKDAYQIYQLGPGPMIPIEWVIGLPSWLKVYFLGQPLWKLLFSLLFLLVLPGLLVLLYRFGGRKTEAESPAPFWKRVLFPAVGAILTLIANDFITEQIRLGGTVHWVLIILLTVQFHVLLGWLVLLSCKAIADAIIDTPRISSKGLDAHAIRISFRILSLIGALGVIMSCTNQLGIPLTPVLAGLGVGGVAVALAAQNSLENFLGGINLFIDRPIRVGDFCRFGGRVGTVEEIGFRSTRLRTLDDTVITIPNSTFSKDEIENFNRREKIWYHPRIQLRQDTSPDQIRYLLVEIRKTLYAHPKVDPAPARIRFVGFGEYSLDLEVFAYVQVTDYGQFLEVAEDLNLRIMEVIRSSGTGLAVPARRAYSEERPDSEEERALAAEEQVEKWRSSEALYLPHFPESVIEELRGGLDYPPKGAPRDPMATKERSAADYLPTKDEEEEGEDRPG